MESQGSGQHTSSFPVVRYTQHLLHSLLVPCGGSPKPDEVLVLSVPSLPDAGSRPCGRERYRDTQVPEPMGPLTHAWDPWSRACLDLLSDIPLLCILLGVRYGGGFSFEGVKDKVLQEWLDPPSLLPILSHAPWLRGK